MTPAFAPPDIVRRKGDKERVSMLVADARGERVRCTWMDERGETHEAWFKREDVELAPADEEVEEE